MKKIIIFTKPDSRYREFIETAESLVKNILWIVPEESDIFNMNNLLDPTCNNNIISHPRKKDIMFDIFARTVSLYSNCIISFYYNRIIQESVLGTMRFKFNFHGSLLPDYAGSHALNWQVLRGETKTGVTVHELTNKIDTGRIVLQKSFDIHEDHTATDVLLGGVHVSCELLNELLSRITGDKLEYSKNTLKGDEFECVKRTEKDGEITTVMSPTDIVNLSKALVHPWPGVYYMLHGKKYIIRRVLSENDASNILEKLNHGKKT